MMISTLGYTELCYLVCRTTLAFLAYPLLVCRVFHLKLARICVHFMCTCMNERTGNGSRDELQLTVAEIDFASRHLCLVLALLRYCLLWGRFWCYFEEDSPDSGQWWERGMLTRGNPWNPFEVQACQSSALEEFLEEEMNAYFTMCIL
jgi:hypothetical protein